MTEPLSKGAPRLAIAMLSHEGNSFTPVLTGIDGFRDSVWCKGKAAIPAFAGTASEMGGVLEFAGGHPDWSVQFLRLAQAIPGGEIAPDVFDAIADEIVSDVEQSGADIVYLALHGALMVADRDLADLSLIRRIREAIGPDRLLGVSFDLHANLDPEIARLVNFASGYKTHPHVDQRETALRVLHGLEQAWTGQTCPVGAIAKCDVILPSINMRTAAGPMAEIEEEAAALLGGDLLEAVPFGGFSYADTLAAGAGAMVFADGSYEKAEAAARTLCCAIDQRRSAFFQTLPSAAQAIDAGLAALAKGAGPVALVDAGDNPLSGGVADTPGLLRDLVAANPSVLSLVVYFWDPVLVSAAWEAGDGGHIEGELGGRLSASFGDPVPFKATVLRVASGHFPARPPLICGPWVDFGQLALIRLDGTQIDVILAEKCASPHDPGLLDALGISLDPEGLFCIKGKNHFRAAYDGRFVQIIACDAPGPAALDIASFPFVRAPSHLYPFG